MTADKGMIYSLKCYVMTLLLIATAVTSPISVSAQSQGNRKVIITELSLNGKTIGPDLYNAIVIAPEDSLVLNYNCQVGQKEETPFIFQVSLANSSGDINTKTYNKTSHFYKGLKESNYTVTICAFSREWRADSAVLHFTVNSSLAPEFKARMKPVDQTASKPDTTDNKQQKENDKQADNEEKNGSGFEVSSIVIGVLIGIASISCIILIIALSNRNKSKKTTSHNKGIYHMGNGQSKPLSRDEIDKIIVENSNLRAEIAALRGQIDAMQTRAEDLKRQNNTLKEQVDRLSESQKELLDLQQQKDDLFAVIIHDIKNPAALIKSLVDLLRSYDLTATEQQEVIDDIMESTKKIVALSQEVTRILSLEGTTLQLSLHPTDINEIVSVVHRRNKVAASDKSIDMQLELQPDIPDSLMDANKIDEVLDNLTSNAIKFSHKGGQVKIKTKFDGKVIYIDISDNGLGLSKEDIQRAFQKGSKLSAKPTGSESSSGFGLWIVKKLIEAHGGNVEVKSTLGVGSTFSVELPYIDIERKEIKKLQKESY